MQEGGRVSGSLPGQKGNRANRWEARSGVNHAREAGKVGLTDVCDYSSPRSKSCKGSSILWPDHLGGRSFTKPPLLQESRLTGGGSPNLVDLVEWKVHVERKVGAL